MNVVGESVTILTSKDPTLVGKRGVVVMETSQMLRLDLGGRVISAPKEGAAFLVGKSEKVVTGSDISGRLEDRWGKAR